MQRLKIALFILTTGFLHGTLLTCLLDEIASHHHAVQAILNGF